MMIDFNSCLCDFHVIIGHTQLQNLFCVLSVFFESLVLSIEEIIGI